MGGLQKDLNSNSGLAIVTWGDSLNVLGAHSLSLKRGWQYLCSRAVRRRAEIMGFGVTLMLSAALTSCASLGMSLSLLKPVGIVTALTSQGWSELRLTKRPSEVQPRVNE